MASISSYWLTLWLWVNWVTPTPSIFTVIVAGAVGHTQKRAASFKINYTIIKEENSQRGGRRFFICCRVFSAENIQRLFSK